jgi:hypothetical protein
MVKLEEGRMEYYRVGTGICSGTRDRFEYPRYDQKGYKDGKSR